mmetsp:Transcript_44983/g.97888  ORF Transcript_44983/g.97888 Transcript_44983/m.97888 type:complete len:213 (+) Transcript_44983:2190-2828(+)
MQYLRSLRARSERSLNFWKKFRPFPQNSPFPAVATQKTTKGSAGRAPTSKESMVPQRTALPAYPPFRHCRATALAHSSACPVSEEYRMVTVLDAAASPSLKPPASASPALADGKDFLAIRVKRLSLDRKPWISLRTRLLSVTNAASPWSSRRGSYLKAVQFSSPLMAAASVSKTKEGPIEKLAASLRHSPGFSNSAEATYTPPYSIALSTSS